MEQCAFFGFGVLLRCCICRFAPCPQWHEAGVDACEQHMVELQALYAVHGGGAHGVVVLFVVRGSAAEDSAVEAAVA